MQIQIDKDTPQGSTEQLSGSSRVAGTLGESGAIETAPLPAVWCRRGWPSCLGGPPGGKESLPSPRAVAEVGRVALR